MKKLLLKFLRRFYNPHLQYADIQIKEWQNAFVKFIVDLVFNGFMWWITALAIISIFGVTWFNLGPGLWHILNIIQFGLISWFFKGTINYLRRKQK